MLMLRDFYAELHVIIKHKLSHRGDLNFNLHVTTYKMSLYNQNKNKI